MLRCRAAESDDQDVRDPDEIEGIEEPRDPEAVEPPIEAAPTGGDLALSRDSTVTLAAPSAEGTKWDPASLQDDRRLHDRAPRVAATQNEARLSSIERQIVMVLDNSQSSAMHLQHSVDRCLGGIHSLESQYYELQRQVVYNANAANSNIERIQDAFEFLRDRDAEPSGCDKLRSDIEALRDEALSGIYALQGQARLFAIAADVDAQDAEIQRSYDEETLAIRHNAESLFQQLRTQEDFSRSLAEHIAAVRAEVAAQATAHDLLQQQVDRLQCTEAARARADVGMHHFATRIEQRTEDAHLPRRTSS